MANEKPQKPSEPPDRFKEEGVPSKPPKRQAMSEHPAEEEEEEE
ncbi:MAG TPA: hypothetical protein VGD42_08550 [Lysobacter sp.]